MQLSVRQSRFLPPPRVCDILLSSPVGGSGSVFSHCADILRRVQWTAILQRMLLMAPALTAKPTATIDLFVMLDLDRFQTCLPGWLRAVSVLTQEQVVAVDGRTVRRSPHRVLGIQANVMVSAWTATYSLVLERAKVDDKATEVTAIPELLRILDIWLHHHHRRYGPPQ